MCSSQFDIIYPVGVGVCLLCCSVSSSFSATNDVYNFESMIQREHYDCLLSSTMNRPTVSVTSQNERVEEIPQEEVIQQISVLTEFASKLLGKMKDLEPDYYKIIEDNLWDLTYDDI